VGVVELHILGAIFRCKGILISHLAVNCLNSARELSVLAAESSWHFYLTCSSWSTTPWGARVSWLELLEIKAEKVLGISGLLKKNYELHLVVTWAKSECIFRDCLGNI